MSSMTIHKVAKEADVSIDTIRLYERIGLIEEPPRAKNGYRQYPKDAVFRLRFIKRAKSMGFTLKEINELLTIRHTSTNTCDNVRQQAEIKLADVIHKVEELQRLKGALQILIRTCRHRKTTQSCPILFALEQQEAKEKQS